MSFCYKLIVSFLLVIARYSQSTQNNKFNTFAISEKRKEGRT